MIKKCNHDWIDITTVDTEKGFSTYLCGECGLYKRERKPKVRTSCSCSGWRTFGFNCFGEVKCDKCNKPLEKPKVKNRYNSFLTMGMTLAARCRNIPTLAKEFEDAMFNISNILKSETMNKKVIKFSEFLPEGFTVDINHPVNIDQENQTISIPFIPSEEFNFEYYVKEYLRQQDFIDETWEESLIIHFKNEKYNIIDFEIRIGLLKFIASKLKIDWMDVLRDVKMVKESVQYSDTIKIIKITGEDFLKSIIND